jgi:molecular chaperone DnaJ
MLGVMQQITPCTNCQGTGKIIKNKCQTCHGEKAVKNTEKVQIDVPAGVDNGMTLKVSGHGNIPTKDAIPGDLYVQIKVKPDPRFERHDYDIFTEYACTFAEAIIGCEADIETVDGPVKIKIPPGTQAGDRIRLKEKGLPNLETRGKSRGNQIVTVKVSIPKYSELNTEQKALIDSYLKTINHSTKINGAKTGEKNEAAPNNVTSHSNPGIKKAFKKH